MNPASPASGAHLTAEQRRLQSLHRYAVLDPPPEAGFDELTQLVSEWLGTLCVIDQQARDFTEAQRQTPARR